MSVRDHEVIVTGNEMSVRDNEIIFTGTDFKIRDHEVIVNDIDFNVRNHKATTNGNDFNVRNLTEIIPVYAVNVKNNKKGIQDSSLTIKDHGAIVRGDTNSKQMAIVFTGDEFADGGEHILSTLSKHDTKASFFLTGNFYANRRFRGLISKIKAANHYLGAHSDQHLLYCDWTNRDSLLVTEQNFYNDLMENYKKMASFGITKNAAKFFLPPYEWYNDSIAAWTKKASLQLINFSSGTRTNADYTTPLMKGYRTSEEIFNSVLNYEANSPSGLNGFILLIHIGTDPARTDKFYHYLEKLIQFLRAKGYKPVRIDDLLSEGE